jgi:hypothetical protein
LVWSCGALADRACRPQLGADAANVENLKLGGRTVAKKKRAAGKKKAAKKPAKKKKAKRKKKK